MFQQFQLLLKRLFIALVFATLCRFIFFGFNAYFHHFSLPDLAFAFFFGLLYDVSACMYVQGVFILFHLLPSRFFYKIGVQKTLFTLFLLGQFFVLLFNLLDTGYFPIAGKRSGMELFDMRNELNGLVIQYLKDYWFLVFGLILMMFLQFKWYKQSYLQSLQQVKISKKLNWISEIGLRFLILFGAIVGARGGLNLLPLNTFDAARQTLPELVPLVVNTPFNLIISTQQAGLKEVNYMWEKEAEYLAHPIQNIEPDSLLVQPKNVVLIIVESLGKEYVGYYNHNKGYTPFLDSLMQFSEVYTHAYSNGKKSIEGIPAILASMPTWMATPYLSSYYQSNGLKSIGAYLQEAGYDASFYHGGRNGTMSFDNFIAISGSGNYYGKDEYPNEIDFDGHWGISDKPYLHYFGRELSTKKEPFFSAIFTLTSHHPYKLPDAEVGKYPLGTMPIHRTVGYTDAALRDFFAFAKKQPWFKHTTFMLTADHSAENEFAYYQSSQGKFEIPFFVFRPNNPHPKLNPKTFSHIDILPLVMQETQYKSPFFSFGSLGNWHGAMATAMQYHDQYYQIIHWPYVYQFDGNSPLAFYRVDTDSLMQKNLLNSKSFKPMQDSLDERVKAIIQTYNFRIIKNKTGLDSIR